MGAGQSANSQMFTSLIVPDATHEEMQWFNELERISRICRHGQTDAPACLSPAYLQARSAFVRKMEARLPARGHLAAEFFDLRTVKDSRGDRKHFPIFNRDVTLV